MVSHSPADSRPAPSPRAAATVVALRPGASDAAPEIFMVRRSARAAFMPDALVFPGGAVDPEDAAGRPEDGPEGSFAVAARRECHEEAGLVVTALHWFDTWITPSAEPRRFYARFFLAEVDPASASAAAADGHETVDGRWATAAAHLTAWRSGQVDLPPPTASTLLRLARADWRDLWGWAPAVARPPILPKWRGPREDGAIEVVMPHDPAYAALPGDAAPSPPRVDGLPRRFLRHPERKIWQPWEG